MKTMQKHGCIELDMYLMDSIYFRDVFLVVCLFLFNKNVNVSSIPNLGSRVTYLTENVNAHERSHDNALFYQTPLNVSFPQNVPPVPTHTRRRSIKLFTAPRCFTCLLEHQRVEPTKQRHCRLNTSVPNTKIHILRELTDQYLK
jgi:hypothetical protein